MLSRRIVLGTVASLILLPTAALSQQTKLPVVASFSILADLIGNIGGDRVSITTLVQPGSDAHVYAPTPADAKTVAEAKLIVTNGLKFEGWMKRLVQSSASKAVLVEAAAGIKARIQKDDHGHAKNDKHGHDHAGQDPHAWQSIGNIRVYVGNIRDALIAADPAGKAAFEANAVKYIGELDLVENEIKAIVAKIPMDRRKVITSHDAFGYFADAYGLVFIAPRGISTEAEASAKDVAKLIQQIRKEKIPAVFMENISDQRLIQQIAKESGAKLGGALFSDSLSKSDGPAPTYIRMMRYNIKTISEALLPTS
jgi:zinc/manganese transport system substrate-binding protein